MKKPWAALVVVSLLVAAPGAWAGVGAGDLEAGVSISLSESDSTIDSGTGDCTTTTTTGTIGASFGWFVLDFLELKAAASASRSGSENDCSTTGNQPKTTLGIFSPGADFVFGASDGGVAPFFGAAYGLAFGDTTGLDTDYYDVHGGLKFFLSERAALELKLTRFEPTEDLAVTGRTELALGINVYF